jgi:hypothetical protein
MAWRFPGLRSFFHPSVPLLTHMVLLLFGGSGYSCQPPPSALYSCTIESASFSRATAKFSSAV